MSKEVGRDILIKQPKTISLRSSPAPGDRAHSPVKVSRKRDSPRQIYAGTSSCRVRCSQRSLQNCGSWSGSKSSAACASILSSGLIDGWAMLSVRPWRPAISVAVGYLRLVARSQGRVSWEAAFLLSRWHASRCKQQANSPYRWPS